MVNYLESKEGYLRFLLMGAAASQSGSCYPQLTAVWAWLSFQSTEAINYLLTAVLFLIPFLSLRTGL